MTSPSPVEVLTQARALLEKGWCQGTFATGRDGREISLLSKRARCFCIDGALMRAANPHGGYSPAAAAVRRSLGKSLPSHIVWNDAPGRTQEEVLALMDRAIALAEQREESRV